MTSVGGIGAGTNIYSLQQSLFDEIDTNGSNTVTSSEVVKAVTAAGGTVAAADALVADLNPSSSGSVNLSQFVQNLPTGPFGSQTGAQMLGVQAESWPAPSTTAPSSGAVMSLFSQMDGNSDGLVTKSELEKAVIAAGGSTAAADALYTQLDPNNTGSFTELQLTQFLQPPTPTGTTAQDGLAALFNLNGSATNGSSPAQAAASVFSQIDANGDGSLTKSELEKAVTTAGGTTAAADALYAQLDPTNTGSVSETQFAQFVEPTATGTTAQSALAALTSADTTTPSATGNTAQDAVQALLNGLSTQASSGSGSSGSSSSTAQQTLATLLNEVLGFGSSGSASQNPLLGATGSNTGSSFFDSFDSSAQSALLAFLQADPSAFGASSGGTSTSQSSVSPAAALAIYQEQSSLQFFSSLTGGGNSGF